MKRPDLRNLLKYFVHGVGLDVAGLVIGLAFAFLVAFLIILGSFIGLIIGFIIFLVLEGVLNSFLTERLWFPIRGSWKTYLYQGVALTILGGLLNLPVYYIVNSVLTSQNVNLIAQYSVEFIIASFLTGFTGKWVASHWRAEGLGLPVTYQAGGQTVTVVSSTPRPRPPLTESVKPLREPIAPNRSSPTDELSREEIRLETMIEYRKKSGLLNPEALDQTIELQKQRVEQLRKAAGGTQSQS